jgi:methylmalonyl-CoA mutase N-terminal domain/subunit
VEERQQLERLKLDPAIEEQQRRRLAELRARRDNGKVAELRARLDAAARGAENLMPLLVECVENHVTLGEICSTLRAVFGEYKPSVII